MFEKVVWQSDRVLLDDLVFRLERDKRDDWELGDACFRFYKTRPLIDEYEKFLAGRHFQPQNVFELGIWDGGSIAFWQEILQPQKYVAVDHLRRGDSPYFSEYLASRNLADRVRTYWGIDQSDAARLREVVEQEFDAPLDLVIDDASHVYGPTRSSFETLFPYLRPGGLYVIEDWAWGHWPAFQAPDHPWAGRTPPTRLILELVEATGSIYRGSSMASLTLFGGIAVAERGWMRLADPSEFKLDNFISKAQL